MSQLAIATIESNEVMQGISDSKVIQSIISKIEIEFFQPQETIFEGPSVSKLYIISKGQVNLNLNGRCSTL